MSRPNSALRGRVRISATSGPPGRRRSLVVLLEEPPDVRGGVGGWQETERAQQRPARWWSGQPGMTMSLAAILDQQLINDGIPSVEARLLTLTALGRRQGGQAAPPALRLAGDVRDPYSAAGGLWVITDLSLGQRLFHRDGRLRRQHVSIELADYESVAAVRAVTVRRTRVGAAKPRTRTVVARRGDTLRTIAVRELGTSAGWQRIRTWNPKVFRGKSVGPDEPLRPGIRLVIK